MLKIQKFSSTLYKDNIQNVLRRSKSIAANLQKNRGRSFSELKTDCARGECLEHAFAWTQDLAFNTKCESIDNVSSWDHDLFDGNYKYEVKQAELNNVGKFGHTLMFHKSIMDVALDPRREFDYFLFGKTTHLNLDNYKYTCELYARISRIALISHSQLSHYGNNTYFFKHGIATKRYTEDIVKLYWSNDE
jgi:hypothetical protein